MSAAPANRPSDLVALTKPRITLMVLLSAAAGYFVGAGGTPDAGPMAVALIGIGLVAAGTSGLNMVWERDIDARMERTRRRPLPAGRVTVPAALGFTTLLAVAGVVFLAVLVNSLTAVLAGLSIVIYVLIYTPLKRRSSLSTLVGAVPGALPIMGGWTAVRGELGPGAWALFGILFFWQLPHFLALAWLFREDYRRGGLQMLGVDDPGARQTGTHSVLYAAALLPASLLPVVIGMGGSAYLLVALGLGLAYGWAAVRFFAEANTATARGLFRLSLAYLPLILIALSVDRGPYPGPAASAAASAGAPVAGLEHRPTAEGS